MDLIIIYNSGRFRMAGRGSASGMMPYGDANAIVVDMAREVLPIVKDTPVLAGVCGTDPFRLMRVFLPELQRLGFDGVQNFPTVGLIDGQFRQILEETGMSIQLEVDMIATAHAARHAHLPVRVRRGHGTALHARRRGRRRGAREHDRRRLDRREDRGDVARRSG